MPLIMEESAAQVVNVTGCWSRYKVTTSSLIIIHARFLRHRSPAALTGAAGNPPVMRNTATRTMLVLDSQRLGPL